MSITLCMKGKFRPHGFKLEKFYQVGEIVQILRKLGFKISRQTIHNYTLLGLITPVKKTSTGRRLYAEDVFDKLFEIEHLKAHRTLSEVKEILSRKK